MSQKSSAPAAREPAAAPAKKPPAERMVRDIRRHTHKHHSAEDKIRVVLEGLRGEESIAALCRREAIAEGLYCSWSKEFLEAGRRRPAGDTARAATTDEVVALRQEARALKEVVAEQALELRFLKRSMIADGADRG
jgi:transposase